MVYSSCRVTASLSAFLISILLVSRCAAFGIVQRRHTLPLYKLAVPHSKVAKMSPLFRSSHRNLAITRFMAEEGEDKAEGSSGGKVEPGEGFGPLKPLAAVFLAGSLFCKFIIVLCIKFLSDAVVYPFLLLYRLARRAKNKALDAIGRGDEKEDAGV